MKKLIALFAVSSVATTGAMAGVALSGTASVSYDDNGSATASPIRVLVKQQLNILNGE